VRFFEVVPRARLAADVLEHRRAHLDHGSRELNVADLLDRARGEVAAL
jgi:hypothetical protein